MTSLQTEPLSLDLISEIGPLLQQHWEEVAQNKQLMVLDPDWGKYLSLDAAGALLVVTARQDGRLKGYSANVIGSHPHYRDLKVSTNDVLFVTPEDRGLTGLRLIRETERQAKRDGAQMHFWHAKPGSQLDKLLIARDYPIQDVIYSKTL